MRDTMALEKQLHIAAAKMQVDGQGKNHYTINHSTDILLLNPKGQLQAYLAFPHKAQQMANDYKLIVKLIG
jgi:cytochrome oxidase Cu insertion factor (SCO1/SenC/PrrC family)